MEKFFNDPKKNRFRLGGLVLEGRLVHFRLCNSLLEPTEIKARSPECSTWPSLLSRLIT